MTGLLPAQTFPLPILAIAEVKKPGDHFRCPRLPGGAILSAETCLRRQGAGEWSRVAAKHNKDVWVSRYAESPCGPLCPEGKTIAANLRGFTPAKISHAQRIRTQLDAKAKQEGRFRITPDIIAKLMKRPCTVCKKPLGPKFWSENYQKWSERKTCSRECGNEQRRRTGEALGPQTPHENICKDCGCPSKLERCWRCRRKRGEIDTNAARRARSIARRAR